MAFERSLTQAVQATRQYLRRKRHGDGQLDVHVVLENLGESALYEGPFLGLAVALALLARATQRQVNSTVAVTGEVRADGSLAGVAGLPEKLQGVAHYNARLQAGLLQAEPITTVVIPTDNGGSVELRTWQARGIWLLSGFMAAHRLFRCHSILISGSAKGMTPPLRSSHSASSLPAASRGSV